jgi:transposase-like protein
MMTMAQPRRFSREFKLEVVRQVDSGQQRAAQVCRAHQLDERQLRRWRREVEERGAAAFTDAPASAVEALERRLAELERICGQLAIENAVLKRGAQLAARAREGRR